MKKIYFNKKIYKVNCKLFIGIILISILILLNHFMINNCYWNPILDNIGCGGLTSGIVAFIIEKYSVKDKNTAFIENYNAIYSNLWAEIYFYITSWNRYYKIFYNDKAIDNLPWLECFEKVKDRYVNDNKNKFINGSFYLELKRSCSCINIQIENIIYQQYYLKTNDYMDDILYYNLIEMKQNWDEVSVLVSDINNDVELFELLKCYNKLLYI